MPSDGERLSLGVRVGLVALAFLLLVVAVVLEPRIASPIRRLVNVEADTAEPIYNVPLDADAIRQARRVLPRRAVYYIHAPPKAHRSALFHDLLGTAYLHLLPAVPTTRTSFAGWILSYRAHTLVPNGIRAERVHRVGERVFVVEVRSG